MVGDLGRGGGNEPPFPKLSDRGGAPGGRLSPGRQCSKGPPGPPGPPGELWVIRWGGRGAEPMVLRLGPKLVSLPERHLSPLSGVDLQPT